MSKKRFTAGLESLFGDNSDDQFKAGGLLATKKDPPKTEKKKTIRRTSSRKNFTTDLDSLLEDVLAETIVEHAHKVTQSFEDKSKSIQNKKRTRKPLTGLDALIRQTVEAKLTTSPEIKDKMTKRVTFTFDKNKFEKLKKIARKEHSYLKDIIGSIVAEFIQEYESKEGLVN